MLVSLMVMNPMVEYVKSHLNKQKIVSCMKMDGLQSNSFSCACNLAGAMWISSSQRIGARFHGIASKFDACMFFHRFVGQKICSWTE